jgi:hypothetical protein
LTLYKKVIYFNNKISLWVFVSEFYYYKGRYKVKVVTESEGYWIVEALEDFKDCIDGEEIAVKAGERRIVPSNDLVKKSSVSPSET